jgi:hypothetical protein
MAYEFKKLSDVNAIESMKDGLNVLIEDGGEIVKISANSIIPDAIPAPATAQVGQTIVVKSVDENGKPTEWEAVNMIVNNSSSIPTVIFVWGEDGTLTCDTPYTEIKQMIMDCSPFKAEIYDGEKGYVMGCNRINTVDFVRANAVLDTEEHILFEYTSHTQGGNRTFNEYRSCSFSYYPDGSFKFPEEEEEPS